LFCCGGKFAKKRLEKGQGTEKIHAGEKRKRAEKKVGGGKEPESPDIKSFHGNGGIDKEEDSPVRFAEARRKRGESPGTAKHVL